MSVFCFKGARITPTAIITDRAIKNNAYVIAITDSQENHAKLVRQLDQFVWKRILIMGVSF